MSQTLGEKIRQAREARGISISEVAEQTRISALYLESIENDDYRPLPGGIFNKGFVKSYAKFVGVDEQEALQDYSRLLAQQGDSVSDEPKPYRSEVLTDDQARSVSAPTIILAIVILGLLAAGVFTLVNYLNKPSQPVANNAVNSNTANTNTNAASATPTPLPAVSEIKAEFKAVSAPIAVSYVEDGKTANKTVALNESLAMTAKETLKVSYYKGFTPDKIQFTLNGKQVTMPAAPARGNTVTFEVNKNNIAQFMQSGAITISEPTAPNASPTRR